jgi:hypothetical protein
MFAAIPLYVMIDAGTLSNLGRFGNVVGDAQNRVSKRARFRS